MRLVLPYPPSVNGTWQFTGKTTTREDGTKAKGKAYLTEKVKKYRKSVLDALWLQTKKLETFKGQVSVDILAYAPDKRIRDIDNIVKAVFDSLTHANIWMDDQYVRRHTVEFSTRIVKGGALIVRVLPFEPVLDGSDIGSLPVGKNIEQFLLNEY